MQYSIFDRAWSENTLGCFYYQIQNTEHCPQQRMEKCSLWRKRHKKLGRQFLYFRNCNTSKSHNIMYFSCITQVISNHKLIFLFSITISLSFCTKIPSTASYICVGILCAQICRYIMCSDIKKSKEEKMLIEEGRKKGVHSNRTRSSNRISNNNSKRK